ncbi:hypothetical protein AURDEDRAFT_126125 [Auricularia subglabra TFB-10046 SS5]|nr:hypothetical protein AURDEDRAFT_126125 [Auricularia subglabra TFB-10046 SS5]
MFAKALIVSILAAAAVFATPVNGNDAGLVKRVTYNDCFNDGFNQGYVAGKHSCGGGKKREVEAAETYVFSLIVLSAVLKVYSPARDEPVELEARGVCQDKLPKAFNAGFNAGFQAGYKTCF